MSDFHKMWVSWALEAAGDLDAEARITLLRACGKRCAQTGIDARYMDLFEKSGRDMDTIQICCAPAPRAA